jgi:hypothetical protein
MIERLLLTCAIRLVPERERDWARAMLGESASIRAPAGRLRWCVGCLGAALRIRADSAEGRFEAVCAGALALLTFIDWHSPDPTLVIVALAIVPALLAYCRPPRLRSIGLLFGLWLLVAHGIADLAVPLRPAYQHLPLSPAEFVEIALLLIIALPAAGLGAQLGRMRR